MRELVTAEHVHGRTGLDGPDLPPRQTPLQAQHAVDFIIDTIRTEPAGSVTIAPIGPAEQCRHGDPARADIAPRIKQIVPMGGGGFEGGNITPAAEFNIYVDPRRRPSVVFGAGIPITMMPLDVTHKALTTEKRNKALRAIGNRTGTAVAEMLDFFERFDEAKYGSDGGLLHDPRTVAWMIAPRCSAGRHCNVEIETASER